MGATIDFNRTPRILEPLPTGEVKLPSPPSLTPPPRFSWFTALLPLAGILFMMALLFTITGLVSDNGDPSRFIYSLAMLPMSLLSALGGILGARSQRKQHRREQEAKEQAYSEALQQCAQQLQQLQVHQQRVRLDKDPDLNTLLDRARARDRRLWERRPTDEDFLNLRVGLGTLPSSIAVSAPRPELPDPRFKPVLDLESAYQLVPNVPIVVDIRSGPLGIAGDLSLRNGLARALIANLVVHHSPDEVHLLVTYSPSRVAEWEWAKWLPHTHVLDSDSRFPHLANDPSSAQELLNCLLDKLNERKNRLSSSRSSEAPPGWPWLVLLVENERLDLHHPALHMLLSDTGRSLNATAIFLAEHLARLPQGCSTVVELSSPNILRVQSAGIATDALSGKADLADTTWSEKLARTLAPLRVFSPESAVALPSNVRLLDILGIEDIRQYDAETIWKSRSPDQMLKAVLGVRRGGQHLVLDLSHTCHGPHGLVAGTTGSGKSELLQTLVVSLALRHHPYDLGFILVDFKGGGAFSPLAHLPHTLGLVTNISGNLAERALVALEAEIKRREHLFNSVNVSDIARYQDLYWQRQGRGIEPLPRVVIIVDEFAELVTDYPEFMDGLVRIARVGRSLGIHLILATQSPRGKVSQQIWANSRFRICLRVEDAAESQDMLHRPDAAYLPRMPGRGYLQVGDNEVFELFQVARVAGRYRAAGDTDTLAGLPTERIVIHEITPAGQRRELYDSKKFFPQQSSASTLTDMEAVAQSLAEAAMRMSIKKLSSPWPEPLPEHIPLPDLLKREGYAGWNGHTWQFDGSTPLSCGYCGSPLRPGARFCPSCGQPATTHCSSCGRPVRRAARFCPACGKAIAILSEAPGPHPPTLPNRPWLNIPLGLLDDPARQRQETWRLELGDQDGHLIVVGAPASGKEMLLRTLVVALAHTHTPDELQFYLVEFGGQALRVLENFPHVAGVFTPLDEERIKRMWVRMEDELEARKELCHQARVDSLERLRKQSPDNVPPAIVVIITGLTDFRQQFPDEYNILLRVVREGGNYDIHVVLAGDRAGDLPTAISSVVARRVALRLGDPDEYPLILGLRPKMDKDARLPLGRGWYGRPPLEFQAASPGYHDDEDEQVRELRQLAAAMRKAWSGPLPAPVEKMPEQLLLDDLLARVAALPSGSSLAVPLGMESVRLRPVWVDLTEDGPDFIVVGTPQSGKTSLLTTWVLSLAKFYSPQQVQFILTAGRRNSLQPLEELPHVLAYARSYRDFQQKGILNQIVEEIHRREALFTNDLIQASTLSSMII